MILAIVITLLTAFALIVLIAIGELAWSPVVIRRAVTVAVEQAAPFRAALSSRAPPVLG